mgnify:CR=1 FL=1
MDISTELAFIDQQHWNNPLLAASAKNMLIALKSLSDYANATEKEMGEVTPQEILNMFLRSDL